MAISYRRLRRRESTGGRRSSDQPRVFARGCRRAPRRDLGCGGTSFKGGRTDLPDRRMSATLVVKHLDVIEQRHLRVAVARKPLGLLLLHGGEEALHHGIVVAVRPTTHA